MTKRILVTGAQGLLGGVLAREFTRRGCEVVATGRRPAPTPAEFSYIPCELSDPAAVRPLFAGKPFDAVIHAAARVPDETNEIAPFVRDNILATAVLAEAARAAETRRFIFCSTVSVYSGDGPFAEDAPTAVADPYGWTKRRAEEACLWSNGGENTHIALRLGGLHGHPRRDGVIFEFVTRALRGDPIQVSEPDTRTTITFFDDVIALIETLMRSDTAPPRAIYNVAAKGDVGLRALAELVLKQVRSGSRIVSPSSSRTRNRVLLMDRARADLGHEPVPLVDHLARLAKALGGPGEDAAPQARGRLEAAPD